MHVVFGTKAEQQLEHGSRIAPSERIMRVRNDQRFGRVRRRGDGGFEGGEKGFGQDVGWWRGGDGDDGDLGANVEKDIVAGFVAKALVRNFPGWAIVRNRKGEGRGWGKNHPKMAREPVRCLPDRRCCT